MSSASFLNRDKVEDLLDTRLAFDKTILIGVMTTVSVYIASNDVINSSIKNFEWNLLQRNRAAIEGVKFTTFLV